MNVVLISSIILLIIILILILILITQTNKPLPRQIVGGCSGTRWGCCPDDDTPKYDPYGTNCRRPLSRPHPRPHSRPHSRPHPRPHSRPHPRPHSRPHSRPHPRPHSRPTISPTPNQHMIGGCESTRYGCCPGSSIASNKNGSHC